MISFRRLLRCSVLIAIATAVSACETGGRTDALAGSGFGALIGKAAGGDPDAALVGAGVGAGVGYVIGNEDDEQKAAAMSRSRPNSTHDETGALGGTRWNLVSPAPRDAAPPYISKVIEFRRDGYVATTTTEPEGNVRLVTERYRVVGNMLIVNMTGYLINARFSVSGDEMIVDTEKFRVVLRMR